jgi:hypothetical protein
MASLTDLLETIRSSNLLRCFVAGGGWFILLTAFHHRKTLSMRAQWMLGGVLGSIASLGLVACLQATVTNILDPREYDFLFFWSFGQALNVGSPYDVDLLHRLGESRGASDVYQHEVYCLYPPPCLPLFWPLGWLPYQSAIVAWYIAIWGGLLATVAQLRRLLEPEWSWLGWLVAAALVLGLHATYSAMFYAQTDFWLVGAWLAACLTANRVRQGLWLGLAIVVKPFAAVIALDAIMRREWRTLAAMAVPVVVALVIFVALQGPAGLETYRTRNPLAGEILAAKYTEPMNQSLLAVLLRKTDSHPNSRPVLFAPFVILGGLLTLATAVVLLRLPKELRSLGIGYTIALGLLIYPGCLAHYCVFLLVTMALLWHERNRLNVPPWAIIAAIALPYGLVWGRAFFAANFVAWLLLTVLLTLSFRKHSPADTAQLNPAGAN